MDIDQLLFRLGTAAAQHIQVAVEYLDRLGQETSRTILPFAALKLGEEIYVHAFCFLRSEAHVQDLRYRARGAW